MRSQFLVSVLIGFGSFLAGLYASHAATVTWNGSVSALWEDSTNWTGGKPTDADTAAFPTTIPGTGATITLADNSETYHLSFSNSYTLTGGKLNFPLIPSEGGNPSSVVVTVGTGRIVTLETQLARVHAGGTVTSGMSKSGAGTLILTGDNSSLAGNWLDVTGGGVLNLQHNKAMGAIPYAHVYPGASLQVENNITIANGVYIRGDGVGGDGALRSVSGDNTWAGYVRVHSLSPGGSIGVDAGSTLTVTGRVEVYNNHPGELHKSGDGVLVFEGDNTYTGPTFVNAGALNIRHNNALGTTAGATTVHAGAALQVQNSITVAEVLVLNGNGIGNSGALRSISGNNVWNGNLEHDNAWIGVDAGSTLTVNGQISGSGELRKVGSGMLVLAGENTYDGDTRIAAGTIRLSGGANRINPDGSLYMTSNTVLDLNGNNQTFAKVDSSAGRIDTGGGMLTVNAHSTYSDIRNRTASPTTVLTGSGGLTKLGSAILYMGGPSDYTGGTFINAGTMALYSKNDCLPVTGDVFVASGATLNLRLYDIDNDQQTIDELSGAGTVQLNGALFIVGNGNSSNGANEFAGRITNGSRTGGGLTKVGIGTQILSGNSDYTGPTQINAGVLNIRHSNALGTTAQGTTVAGGATLEVQGSIAVAEALTLNGLGAGDAGALRSRNGDNVWNGNVVLSTARIGVDAGGTLTVNGQISGSGEFSKIGAGTLVLTAENNYAGLTRIRAGTLQLAGGPNRLPAAGSVYVESAGTFDLNGQNQAVNQLTVANGRVQLNDDAILTVNYGDVWAGTVLSGSGRLVKTGTGNLTFGANTATHTGGTFIEQGRLWLYYGNNKLPTTGNVTISSAGTLDLAHSNTPGTVQTIGGLFGSGTVSIGNAGSVVNFIVGNGDRPGSFSGVLQNGSGTLSLTKTGLETLELAGASTYTGGTVVGAGTLLVSNTAGSATGSGPVTVSQDAALGGTGSIGGPVSVGAGGILAPGRSVGTLYLQDGLAFAEGAFFDVDIEQLGLADLVQMDGGLLAPNGATIRVNLGFSPELGHSWTILQGEGARDGIFDTNVAVLSGSEFLGGWKRFEVGYNNSVVLTVVPEPGAVLLLACAFACGLLVRRRKQDL